MGGITLGYFLRRLADLFFDDLDCSKHHLGIPRLAPGDPITAMVNRMISQSGYVRKF